MYSYQHYVCLSLGAIVGLGFASYFTYLSLITVVQCGQRCKCFNYSELCRHCFGLGGELLFDIMIYLFTLGNILSYVTIVGSTSSQIMIDWVRSNQNTFLLLNVATVNITFSIDLRCYIVTLNFITS